MASPIPMPASTYMLGQPAAQGQPIPLDPNGGRQYQDGALPAQQVPQTGLIGSEQALMQGQAGNDQALQGGLAQSTQTLGQGMNSANNTILGGTNAAIGVLGNSVGQSTGYLNGVADPQNKAVLNSYSADTSVGSNITDPLNQGAANFTGYLGGGQAASKMQADLTGANGPQAQQAAYAAYQSSPAMQYQMDQMQKATERSAAARGGALGGNVLMELQRNAAGIASQDYQNQFANMGTVANQGLNAASQVANLKATQAGIAGNLQQSGIAANAQAAIANQNAQNQQQIVNQQQKYDVAGRLADIANTYGINVGNLLTGAASTVGLNQYNTGTSIGKNQYNTGTLLGQSSFSTGINKASGRTNAGTAIAKNATDAAAGIGKLLESQGVNVSNEMAGDINNVTKMISDYGLQDKISNENLAAMIANITGGQATNTQNAYGNIGAAQAAGTMGVSNAVQGGVTQGLMLGAIGKPNYYSSQYDQAFSEMPFSKG